MWNICGKLLINILGRVLQFQKIKIYEKSFLITIHN